MTYRQRKEKLFPKETRILLSQNAPIFHQRKLSLLEPSEAIASEAKEDRKLFAKKTRIFAKAEIFHRECSIILRRVNEASDANSSRIKI